MPTNKLRLLMFNLVVDIDDPILGFTTQWINELARYCEYIDVITMQTGNIQVPENVRVFSVGREKGYSEPRRVAVFYRLLLGLRRERGYDACFAHMMPLFAGMAGPLLKLWRIPITLWYVHRQISNQLRLGLAMSNRIVTAAPSTFPIETNKLHVLGHGIDTDFFQPDDKVEKSTPPMIVHVGRLTPIKNQHHLLYAIVDLAVQVVLVGDVPDGYDADYKHHLASLVDELNIAHKVIFAGNQSPEGVRGWLQKAHVHVNLTEIGSFDKSVLEGMACAVPTIVCNPAFNPLLVDYTDMLSFSSPDDVDGLRQCLQILLDLSGEEQTRIGEMLRERVVAAHSLKHLIRQIVHVLETGEPA